MGISGDDLRKPWVTDFTLPKKRDFENPLPKGNGFSVTQIRYPKNFRYPHPLPKSVTIGNGFFFQFQFQFLLCFPVQPNTGRGVRGSRQACTDLPCVKFRDGLYNPRPLGGKQIKITPPPPPLRRGRRGGGICLYTGTSQLGIQRVPEQETVPGLGRSNVRKKTEV